MLMKKENYSAWHINSELFSEDWSPLQKLQFFIKYAVLAPSGHNTQPWLFKHKGQALLLTFNASKSLGYSGSLAAEPYVSLGSCLETLRLAALGFGYELQIAYEFKDELIATIELGAKQTADKSLLKAITQRVSNRSSFSKKPLPESLQTMLTHSEFDDVSLLLVSDQQQIEFLAEQTKVSTETIMTDAKFRAELSMWVRNNHTKKYDGMPGFAQGMPTPPSMVARQVVKRIDISKTQAKKDSKRVLESSSINILMAHNTRPTAFLNVGRLYARNCVLAQQQGVASSGVGAAAIDPTAKKLVKDTLGLKHLPTAMIRLGYASKPARHTPRWPASRVTS